MIFYEPFKEDIFDSKNCFLCGEAFQINAPVFPLWLQEKYHLPDRKLVLDPKTTISYKNLTIPLCKNCNQHLSKLEARFQCLLDQNFQNLSKDDEQVIFQWTAKTLYAIQYNKLLSQCSASRKKPHQMLNPKEMESFADLHLLLQSLRFHTVFKESSPWSLFIFTREKAGFDYTSLLNELCLSIKFDNLVIIIVFEDNGLTANALPALRKLANQPLNLAQYLEVKAYIFYYATLRTNVPKYYVDFRQNRLLIRTIGTLDFRRWNHQEFCKNFDFLLHQHGIFRDQALSACDAPVISFFPSEDDKSLMQRVQEYWKMQRLPFLV